MRLFTHSDAKNRNSLRRVFQTRSITVAIGSEERGETPSALRFFMLRTQVPIARKRTKVEWSTRRLRIPDSIGILRA